VEKIVLALAFHFPQEREISEVAFQFTDFSKGKESAEGRWASGPYKDGMGEFEYVAEPAAMGPETDEFDPRSSHACTRP
jgi:Mn-containing catalase